MCTCEEWKHRSNSWSITESIFAQGRAKGKLGGVCWRSLSINFIPSTQQEKGLIWVHLLDIGVTLTEFHEFWWLSISAGGYQKENQRRPTCHDYIEIKTERVKLYNLEDSRRRPLKAGPHLAGWAVGRPRGGVGRLPISTNQVESRGSCLHRLWGWIIIVHLGRFDPRAVVHPRGLYIQSPWPLGETLIHSLFIHLRGFREARATISIRAP